jgi:hypothetical protein
VIIFRVVATLAGLFFVVAVVLMASAPWVLLQPDQDVNTELNRWFLTVAGSVDAITAGSSSRCNRVGHCWSSNWQGQSLWLARSSFPSSPASLPSSRSA